MASRRTNRLFVASAVAGILARRRARRPVDRGGRGGREDEVLRRQQVQGHRRVRRQGPLVRRQERLQGAGLAEDRQGHLPEDAGRPSHAGRLSGRWFATGCAHVVASTGPVSASASACARSTTRTCSAGRPACRWFEAITENYMDTDGPSAARPRAGAARPSRRAARRRRCRSARPTRSTRGYLEKLARLVERIEPASGHRSPVLDRASAAAASTTCCRCPTRTKRSPTSSTACAPCRISSGAASCSRIRRRTSPSATRR